MISHCSIMQLRYYRRSLIICTAFKMLKFRNYPIYVIYSYCCNCNYTNNLKQYYRQADKEKKQRESKERKLANKEALDEEEKNLAPSGRNPSPKMTRARIQELRDKEIKEKNKTKEKGLLIIGQIMIDNI